jgi:hypothetical protein
MPRTALSPYYGKTVCLIGKPSDKERHNRRLFIKPFIKYCQPAVPQKQAKDKHFNYLHYLTEPVNIDNEIHHLWVDQQVIREGCIQHTLFKEVLAQDMRLSFAGKVYTYVRKDGSFDYCLCLAGKLEREICLLFACEQLFNYHLFYSGNPRNLYGRLLKATYHKGRNNPWLLKQGAENTYNLYREYVRDKLATLRDLSGRELSRTQVYKLRVAIDSLEYLEEKLNQMQPRLNVMPKSWKPTPNLLLLPTKSPTVHRKKARGFSPH